MDNNKLQAIYDSFINGQRKQAIELINEYGRDRFWASYAYYLEKVCYDMNDTNGVYTTHSITYHKIMQVKESESGSALLAMLILMAVMFFGLFIILSLAFGNDPIQILLAYIGL